MTDSAGGPGKAERALQRRQLWTWGPTGRTAAGFRQCTGRGRKPPQTSGKVRSEGANGSLGRASLGPGRRRGEPWKLRFRARI